MFIFNCGGEGSFETVLERKNNHPYSSNCAYKYAAEKYYFFSNPLPSEIYVLLVKK
jgi:hypothetical protein